MRLDALRPREAHDGLHDGERIAGAVIDFARQQFLAFFRLLAIGDVSDHSADPDDAARIDAGRRRADAPAQLAVRPTYAKLGLKGLGIRGDLQPRLGQAVPVLRMNEGTDVLDRHRETARVDAEDSILPLVPGSP